MEALCQWFYVKNMLLYTHTCPVTEFAVASHLNTANSCCHHVFLRHFRFQKCLSVNSYRKMPLAFILSLQSLPCKNLFIILIILLILQLHEIFLLIGILVFSSALIISFSSKCLNTIFFRVFTKCCGSGKLSFI